MENKRFVVDIKNLPSLFPTHRHSAMFWENLGRTIATFGFLEEVLGKAIFAFTATARYPESEVEAAFEKWLPTLERALIDPLAGLIDAYGKAVRNNSYQLRLITSLLADMATSGKACCRGSCLAAGRGQRSGR
jgi:hypothetical protein